MDDLDDVKVLTVCVCSVWDRSREQGWCATDDPHTSDTLYTLCIVDCAHCTHRHRWSAYITSAYLGSPPTFQCNHAINKQHKQSSDAITKNVAEQRPAVVTDVVLNGRQSKTRRFSARGPLPYIHTHTHTHTHTPTQCSDVGGGYVTCYLHSACGAPWNGQQMTESWGVPKLIVRTVQLWDFMRPQYWHFSLNPRKESYYQSITKVCIWGCAVDHPCLLCFNWQGVVV